MKDADLTRIRDVRKRLGWTQSRLAALIRVTSSTISRWERARHRPSKAYQASLALFLGTEHLRNAPKSHPLQTRQTEHPPQCDEAYLCSSVQPTQLKLDLIPVTLR